MEDYEFSNTSENDNEDGDTIFDEEIFCQVTPYQDEPPARVEVTEHEGNRPETDVDGLTEQVKFQRYNNKEASATW